MPATKPYEEVETKNVKGDELPWVPFEPYSDEVPLKYYMIDPVKGEILVSMRFPRASSCPSIITPDRDRAHYPRRVAVSRARLGLEAGDTVYETAASTHTPRSVGEEDAEVFFLVVGEPEFVDDDGNLLARENWKTSRALPRL